MLGGLVFSYMKEINKLLKALFNCRFLKEKLLGKLWRKLKVEKLWMCLMKGLVRRK